MRWTATFFSRRVEDEILAMPAGFVARFVRYAESMEVFGPDLGMPHTKAMGGGSFELRLEAAEGIARIFYYTVVGQRIVPAPVHQEDGKDTPKGAGNRPPTDEGVEA
jgi:phage-related protein